VLVFEDGRTEEVSGGSDYATNNEMELAAILGGIEAFEESHEVLVKTDSQVAHRYLTGLKSAGQPYLHEI
jgi:ribonuclease HI